MAGLRILVLSLCLVLNARQISGQCSQTGTTTNSHGEYECLYAGTTIPLTAGSFTPVPESIKIQQIPSTVLAANAFSGMSTLTNNSFAGGVIPKMELTCQRYEYLHFTNTTFDGLDYVEWFGIRYCRILAIDGDSFNGLGTVYSFGLMEGQIGSLSDMSFRGVNMLSSFTTPGAGTFNITSNIPQGGVIPPNLFAPLGGVTHLNLNDMGLGEIPSGTFNNMSELVYLNLTNNFFLRLTEGQFDSFVKIRQVDAYYVRWLCDCGADTWIIDWAETNNVVLKSDFGCDGRRQSLVRYKKDECDEKKIGFYILDVYWFGLEEILLWICNLFSFFTSIAALIIICEANKKPKKKRRPPPTKDQPKQMPKGLKRAADKVRRMQRKMNLGWG